MINFIKNLFAKPESAESRRKRDVVAVMADRECVDCDSYLRIGNREVCVSHGNRHIADARVYHCKGVDWKAKDKRHVD